MKYKMSEIMDLISGGTPKTSVAEYWNGSIPWLSVKDFNDDKRTVKTTEKSITEAGLKHSSTNLLQPGDTIISARGTVGELAMIVKPMAFNQSCYGMRAKENIVVPEFLYYLMKHNVYVLKHHTHGSVFDTITKATFDELTVDIPSIEKQKQIAGLLLSFDEKIELNAAINKNLLEQAQMLFDDFFFSRPVPETWSKSTLTGIANYLNGLAMQNYRPLDGEEGLPVLKIKELRQGACASDSELCSPNIKAEYIVHDRDVIFSWSASLIVDFWCGGICGLNQHLFKVTSDHYDKWFIYAWTKHHLDKFISIAAGKATTMGHIKRNDLDMAEVLIPNKEDYMYIGSVLAPMYDMIMENRIKNRKLTELRDALLPKLLSGELDVSAIQL